MEATKVSNFLLKNNLVDQNKLKSASIANSKIQNLSITNSKLANDVLKQVQTTGNLIQANYNANNQTVELTSPLEITFGYEYVNDMTNSTTADFAGFRNFADIFPPEGKTIQNLVGFIPSHRDVMFDGGVDANDTFYCRWFFHDGKQVIRANRSNVFPYNGMGAFGATFAAGANNCTITILGPNNPDGTTLKNIGLPPIIYSNEILRMIVTGGPDPFYSTITLNTPLANLTPAAAGETWTFSVYAKADRNTTGELFITGATESGSYIPTDLSALTINITTNWQRFSVTRTFTKASTKYLQIRVDGPPSGFAEDGTTRPTIYWAGVQVEKSPTPTVYKTDRNNAIVYEIPTEADRIRVYSGNTEQRKDEEGNNGSFNYIAFWI